MEFKAGATVSSSNGVDTIVSVTNDVVRIRDNKRPDGCYEFTVDGLSSLVDRGLWIYDESPIKHKLIRDLLSE